MSILITGSTGKFGKNSIDFLLSNGVDPKSIIALVREESKGKQFQEKGLNIKIAGNGIGNYATRKDMAEAAVNILLDGDKQKHLNKKYIISNEESLSFEDAAKILSEISGNNISYTTPDVATFENTLTGFGVPPFYIQLSVAFGLAIQNNEFNTY
ncbi:hypothetical protein ACTFIY_011264 [Dictyostelium cf. discoideum]